MERIITVLLSAGLVLNCLAYSYLIPIEDFFYYNYVGTGAIIHSFIGNY